jgi:hypothetical protein
VTWIAICSVGWGKLSCVTVTDRNAKGEVMRKLQLPMALGFLLVLSCGGSKASAPTGTGGRVSSPGGANSSGGAGSGGATGGTTGTAGAGSVPTIAGCNIFPADNPWNLDISGYPLNPNSASYIANMSPSTAFHPDWGTVTDEYGIPFSTGTGATPQPLTWTEDWGATESDPLPVPRAATSSATRFR